MVRTRTFEDSILNIPEGSIGRGLGQVPCGGAPSPPTISLEQLLAMQNDLMRRLVENNEHCGSFESRNTSVASRILVLAASSRASWESCQHYFRHAGTCEHLDMEVESLMNLLLLAPSLGQYGYVLSHVPTKSHHGYDGK
jgi:hypothetical protein